MIMVNYKLLIKNIWKNELSNSGLDVTVNDVENYVNQYNKTMQGKNGEKAKENLVAFKKEVEKQQQKNSTSTSNRDACDAITVTGFAHTTATSRAMVALGVSGPVGWGVAAGMEALYAGESIACNHA